MGLCGQGRGSCSMYPSWSLILIWSWILIRLRNGGTLSPVQTLRIPAEPKRRRRVRITPSENISRYVNKCSYQGVYLGRHLWSKPKYKDLPWILKWAKKQKKQTKQKTKLWISKYNMVYRTCNYWKHSTTALYYNVYVKKDKKTKTEQPYNADFYNWQGTAIIPLVPHLTPPPPPVYLNMNCFLCSHPILFLWTVQRDTQEGQRTVVYARK